MEWNEWEDFASDVDRKFIQKNVEEREEEFWNKNLSNPNVNVPKLTALEKFQQPVPYIIQKRLNIFRVMHLNGYYITLSPSEDELEYLNKGYECIGMAMTPQQEKEIIMSHSDLMMKRYNKIYKNMQNRNI